MVSWWQWAKHPVQVVGRAVVMELGQPAQLPAWAVAASSAFFRATRSCCETLWRRGGGLWSLFVTQNMSAMKWWALNGQAAKDTTRVKSRTITSYAHVSRRNPVVSCFHLCVTDQFGVELALYSYYHKRSGRLGEGLLVEQAEEHVQRVLGLVVGHHVTCTLQV